MRNVERLGAHFPTVDQVKETVVMFHVHPIRQQRTSLRRSVQRLIFSAALPLCCLLQLLRGDQLPNRLLRQRNSKSLGPRSEPRPNNLQRRIINAFFGRYPAG